VHWGLTPYGLSFKNIKELFIYLPFKAHTKAKNKRARCRYMLSIRKKLQIKLRSWWV